MATIGGTCRHAAPGNAAAAPVQCNNPANVVLATICASPMLTARDAEIAQRYEQWSGEIRRDASGNYLYLSDVLGAPL